MDFLGEPYRALRMWSKEAYGNIFIEKATLEDIIKAKEAAYEIDLSPSNRAELKRTEAELKRYI